MAELEKLEVKRANKKEKYEHNLCRLDEEHERYLKESVYIFEKGTMKYIWAERIKSSYSSLFNSLESIFDKNLLSIPWMSNSSRYVRPPERASHFSFTWFVLSPYSAPTHRRLSVLAYWSDVSVVPLRHTVKAREKNKKPFR